MPYMCGISDRVGPTLNCNSVNSLLQIYCLLFLENVLLSEMNVGSFSKIETGVVGIREEVRHQHLTLDPKETTLLG